LRLIVGLGNPGEEYAATRHNVGFLVVERAAARWRIGLRRRGEARRGEGRVGEVAVALAMPLSWMNRCGPTVKALLDELALSPADLVVVHDDLDMDPGRLRLRRDGGTGGHNGLLSLITALGTADFPRLKVGIGRPEPGEDPADYVLSPVREDQRAALGEGLDRAVLALECLVTAGLTAAMNRFNSKPKVEG
jgi:PTH1 family peptidyl-tRNA hydrolase